MITEVPSCILSQYRWYNRNIQVDNSCVYFLKLRISIMFPNFLLTMDPLNNSMNLRQNTTYKKVFFSMATIPQRWKIIIKESHENATNLIIMTIV